MKRRGLNWSQSVRVRRGWTGAMKARLSDSAGGHVHQDGSNGTPIPIVRLLAPSWRSYPAVERAGLRLAVRRGKAPVIAVFTCLLINWMPHVRMTEFDQFKIRRAPES